MDDYEKSNQSAFDDLISEVGMDPDTAWYPNSGMDFRDVVELSSQHGESYGKTEMPKLFIHTDYMPKWGNDVDINNPFQVGPIEYGIHNHEVANTFITSIHRLQFKEDIHIAYYVDPAFADFPDAGPDQPLIFLLRINVHFRDLYFQNVPVIYFIFESINFLDQVILNKKIRISHMVKVREGCGFGGNRKSISLAYAFAMDMGICYLFADKEIHTDYPLITEIAENHRMELECFDIEIIHHLGNWSGFATNLYRISPCLNPAEYQTAIVGEDDSLNGFPKGGNFITHIFQYIRNAQ